MARRSLRPLDTFAARFKKAIAKKGWGELSDRDLLERLKGAGKFDWSEPTLRRDRHRRELPSIKRVFAYARALGISPDRLRPSAHPPAIPGGYSPSDDNRWALCPNKWCPAAKWKNEVVVEYSWVHAEQEKCPHCGAELIYGCQKEDCQRVALPLRRGELYCGRCGDSLFRGRALARIRLLAAELSRMNPVFICRQHPVLVGP
jgi:hypothetical protein